MFIVLAALKIPIALLLAVLFAILHLLAFLLETVLALICLPFAALKKPNSAIREPWPFSFPFVFRFGFQHPLFYRFESFENGMYGLWEWTFDRPIRRQSNA